MPPARFQPGQLLPVAGQVRRHGGRRREAPEGAGAGEQPPEAVAGRGAPGHRGAEGRVRGKTLAPQRKREAIRRMCELTSISERRACRLAGISRDAFRHAPTPTPATQTLSARLVELAQARRRFGYRRLHDLLRPEFPQVNHKKIYRLYREAKLSVRRRKKAKFPAAQRQPLRPARHPNEVISMDFVFDQLASGRRIKCLTVADDFTHECVDIAVDHGISGAYVVRVLEQIACFRGYPRAVRTDNGPEFTSRAVDSPQFNAR
ncbi:IS1477 transposase [Xanthomonas campestris pv. campestris str. ATCC 33913]|uniref:IS1477 transposase n=1 Tax=Xanthomonas campestris pv. campestris (strain ATCC 33913 / DSM 3586 / NCPPB 528 / LMG 568 / P 25) TaxID=190485 RepID=Q8P652_XANCP|nr:IS1477 transposase [Xanthomonas campestris pv. campestris str. ATCC 33913]